MPEPHAYTIRVAPGGFRILRDAGTDDERGLSNRPESRTRDWVAPDEAEQRWPTAQHAALALAAQLSDEQRGRQPARGR